MSDHEATAKRLVMQWDGDTVGHQMQWEAQRARLIAAVAAALAEAHHCKWCCCARSWAALGVTEYTGKSIPEHIEELRAEIDKAKAAK